MTGSAEFKITPDPAFFVGHFDGNPILPAVAQFTLVSAALKELVGDVWIAEVLAARFRAPVLPGEQLTVKLPPTSREDQQRFDILRGSEVITQGVLRVERSV